MVYQRHKLDTEPQKSPRNSCVFHVGSMLTNNQFDIQDVADFYIVKLSAKPGITMNIPR